MTNEDFDEAIDSATHALNSMTHSHGRPPYMAVFGQIPRVGTGLLQDDKALINKDDQPGSVRPEILKALIEINASQSLRRARLRKTATAYHNELLPGQNCAYWRWQNPRGRSTKKRGAWVVARFLAYDPDGRSAWLHAGTTTVQASLEQIRAERVQPTYETTFGMTTKLQRHRPMRMSMTTSYISHSCRRRSTTWTMSQHHRTMRRIHYHWHLHQQHPSPKPPHHHLTNYHHLSTQDNRQQSHNNNNDNNNKPYNSIWMSAQETSISIHRLMGQQQQCHKAHHVADRSPT